MLYITHTGRVLVKTKSITNDITKRAVHGNWLYLGTTNIVKHDNAVLMARHH